MNPDIKIPTFNDALPIDLFLKSSRSYIYDDLRQFEHVFLRYLTGIHYDFNKPLALGTSSSDELVFLIASCWRLGIPFVPLDPELPGRERDLLFQELEIGLFINEGEYENSSGTSFATVDIDRFALSRILHPDFTPEEWVEEHKKHIHPEQFFGYFLTSGTTGVPKIVPLKRRQMLFSARGSAKNLQPGRNHLWLLSLPLHHIGGVSVILRSLLYGSGIYRTDGFDIARTVELLQRDSRLAAASLVPTMLNRLMDRTDFSVHDDFQAILLGGGPIAPSLVDQCFNRGIPIISSYGMTESCAQIAANPLMRVGDLSRPRKSVGRVFDPNSIEIRNQEGESVTDGESGLIWLRGPQLFDGYLNRENNFDDDNWFNTGDFGHLNEQNELFIESRRTDLIISGGENISPAEIEQALKNNFDIRDAAVVGIPDKEWGQRVVAIVTTEDDRPIDRNHIQAKLKEVLQSFKIPKEIIKTDFIPRTKTGKIKRDKVKDIFSK
ncbi:2-succinylbenzoyl-CoA synthetase [Fodinibius roseus]|uniref:2-succinylbenzoyl-CoA synthetase n=1 Tax=Fodinibius roseus TaxID=1194090 RepID=A0A1M4TJD9_9BACT|nr:AMP-binding protein [Fodinibius roseus]SHE44591.1 2-succinylbenzoyl-CoA synthetase [Fodinibius roseus]